MSAQIIETTGDYVDPVHVVQTMSDYGARKTHLAVSDMLLRGVLSGMILGFATSVSFQAVAEGAPGFVGALLFPLGFCILILLGFELVTGSFALIPVALFDRRVGMPKLLRSWGWVYLGNLIGSLAYASLLWAALTKMGNTDAGELGAVIVAKAEAKTLAYKEVGAYSGVSAAFVKGLLCNWMVATGTIMAFVSKSTVGKIMAMWLPIFAFFAMGFEHSVVNMFVIPAGILFGDTVSISDWWLWNQVSVTIGNIVGAFVLVAVALHYTHGRQRTE